MNSTRLFLFAGCVGLAASTALGGPFPAPPLYPSFNARSATFTTFGINNSSFLTIEGINTSGVTAGEFQRASDKSNRGFVRAANGAITAFQAPDATSERNKGTFVAGINDAGTIVGTYIGVGKLVHGLVRAANGTVTAFDVASKNIVYGTNPSAINAAGTIVGYYFDSNLTRHGFLRAANGAIKKFNAPGAGTGELQGTHPIAINAAGVVTGSLTDDGNVNHGFVRAANGTITTFDVPGASTSQNGGTIPAGIDAKGEIAGTWQDTSSAHCFFRDANGKITSFDIPHDGQELFVAGMNSQGEAIGYVENKGNTNRAFLRRRDGTVMTFEAPNTAGGATGGTFANAISDKGLIGGNYVSNAGKRRAFLRMP